MRSAYHRGPRTGSPGCGGVHEHQSYDDCHRERPWSVVRLRRHRGERRQRVPGGPPDLRSEWTQIFYRSTLGTDGVLYDLTSRSPTVAEVLSAILPEALALHPQLALVWLSTADIVAATTPLVYEQELRQLVESLKTAGATVLLANAAPPVVFPALVTCESNPADCTQGGSTLSSPVLQSTVSVYDNVIAAVARQTGADMVNVHSALEQDVQVGGVENVLSSGGMELSNVGATAVAHAFGAQLPGRYRSRFSPEGAGARPGT